MLKKVNFLLTFFSQHFLFQVTEMFLNLVVVNNDLDPATTKRHGCVFGINYIHVDNIRFVHVSMNP